MRNNPNPSIKDLAYTALMANESNVDKLVATVTASKTWAELKSQMEGGYVPTIMVYPGDSKTVQNKKALLVRIIRERGFKVWTGIDAKHAS